MGGIRRRLKLLVILGDLLVLLRGESDSFMHITGLLSCSSPCLQRGKDACRGDDKCHATNGIKRHSLHLSLDYATSTSTTISVFHTFLVNPQLRRYIRTTTRCRSH